MQRDVYVAIECREDGTYEAFVSVENPYICVIATGCTAEEAEGYALRRLERKLQLAKECVVKTITMELP